MTTHNSIRLLLDRCHEWDKSARELVTERAAIMETARGLGMAAIVKKMVAWPKAAEPETGAARVVVDCEPAQADIDADLDIPKELRR